MPNRVLVLDANQRSALAVTRSLGQRGVEVVCADRLTRSLAGASRYCHKSVSYRSPVSEQERFLADVARLIEKHAIDVLLPVTDVTTSLLMRNRAAAGSAVLPFPGEASYDSLVNKRSLVALAQRLSLPVPATYAIGSAAERYAVYEKVRFPVVVKPAYSKVELDGHWRGLDVLYAKTIDELERMVGDHPCLGVIPLLVQQQISGVGHGVFALYDHGRPVVFFSHQRLRERPPMGGVSVLCESVAPNEKSLRVAERLLSHVGWHGVAMVEFKLDRDGEPYLLEVNGRFWGSLQLAIDAGIDFPYLLYRLAMGEQIDEMPGYRVGCRSRWLLGDLDTLYWILHKRRGDYSPRQKWRAVHDFFKPVKSSRHEINRWEDPGPFFYELANHFGGGD